MSSLDLIGYTGSALFITAYYFNSKETQIEKTYKFQLLNILAGISSIIYSYNYGAHASIMTNIIWIIITINSLKPMMVKKINTISLKNKGVINEKTSYLSSMYRN